MPKVHNKYHNTASTDTVYIGRGTKWGNPFTHTGSTFRDVVKVATREEAVKRFREYLMENPTLVQAAKIELKGKDLVCFCAPASCHGDVLIEIANED